MTLWLQHTKYLVLQVMYTDTCKSQLQSINLLTYSPQNPFTGVLSWYWGWRVLRNQQQSCWQSWYRLPCSSTRCWNCGLSQGDYSSFKESEHLSSCLLLLVATLVMLSPGKQGWTWVRITEKASFLSLELIDIVKVVGCVLVDLCTSWSPKEQDCVERGNQYEQN